MDKRERYFWDLTGYLVLRDVLTADEIAAANEAIDHCADQIYVGQPNEGAQDSQILQGTEQRVLHGLLELDEPYCEPFRKMLVHPQIIMRLNVMCGTGFRFDHGPWVTDSVKGTEGLVMHGQGEPHRPYVAYHHQNNKMHCGGVTVTWQLSDINAGEGGFACVPGSHKSRFPMPHGVRTCDDDMGVVLQPEMKAGDVIFFMDGAQAHGTLVWRGEHHRRSVLFKYADRTSVRTGVAREIAPPEIYWGEELVEGMTEAQRAVMYGPCSSLGTTKLTVDGDGTVRVEND